MSPYFYGEIQDSETDQLDLRGQGVRPGDIYKFYRKGEKNTVYAITSGLLLYGVFSTKERAEEFVKNYGEVDASILEMEIDLPAPEFREFLS